MVDGDKRSAASAATSEVSDGMLVGLGSGTTAAFFIEELGRRCAGGLRIIGVAPSLRSEALARTAGIPLRDMGEVGTLDLAVDGVDEIDARLVAIKGGGGAMLREKIVATAATRMVAIADGSKCVARLGQGRPVPLEVLPFAQALVARRAEALGATVSVRPNRSDQGNLILDCRFAAIDDPAGLAEALAAIPGMLGHGLFLTEVASLYVAEGGTVRRIDRPAER